MISNKKGFTLIEILVVVGIITILVMSAVVLIRPGQFYSDARDVEREAAVNSLMQAVLEYQLDNNRQLPVNIPVEETGICKSDAASCEGLIDLSILEDQHYITSIPTDPSISGGNSSGYNIWKDDMGRVYIKAPLAEQSVILLP